MIEADDLSYWNKLFKRHFILDHIFQRFLTKVLDY